MHAAADLRRHLPARAAIPAQPLALDRRRRWSDVLAIKIAPFNRYRSLGVVRAVDSVRSSRSG